MKEISKAQVIGLMDKIQQSGIDNSRYTIDVLVTERNLFERYGGDDFDATLKPGAYCVIWFNEVDCSDEPIISNWIDASLKEENIEYVSKKNDDGCIIIICLDLL